MKHLCITFVLRSRTTAMPTATLTAIVNTCTPSITTRVMMTSVHGVTSSQVTHPGEHGSHTRSLYYRQNKSKI